MPFRPRITARFLCLLMASCVIFPHESYLALNSQRSNLKELQVREATFQKATTCP
jgi:hypothetical protein